MIYTIEYLKGNIEVDTDKIAGRFLENKMLYVHPHTQAERNELVEFLEEEGFICKEDNSFNRQEILESRFPLIIELREKSIYCMGNVTCAAAAATSRIIMSDKEFYLLYSIDTILKKNE